MAGAGYVLSLLKFLKSLLDQVSNGGLSPAAPESAVDSISTSKDMINLVIERTNETKDAIFGKATVGNECVCFTMERTAVCIPARTYPGYKRHSPHLDRTVVGIDVPNRTDIEIHNANLPSQLQGCIAVGLAVDGDALDNSIAALEKLLGLLPQTFTVTILDSIPR